ncbi:Uncharacterised protein [Bacillus freudenreichii]|nr:Uncharacterised protein [Bacillus freudenreichii]
MIGIIKKIISAISGNPIESDLMSRAVDITTQTEIPLSIGNLANSISSQDDIDELIYQSHLDDQMFHDQMDQDRMFQDQMQRDMHDPYLNPGQDIVVDESYHGIDHGGNDHF